MSEAAGYVVMAVALLVVATAVVVTTVSYAQPVVECGRLCGVAL